MNNKYNIVLYAWNLFGQSSSPSTGTPVVTPEQSDQLLNSGFTTVILWTLHIEANGDFVYNDIPIVREGTFSDQFSGMSQDITKLKSSGGVKKVFLGIGSGGVSDYHNITNLLQTQNGQQTLQNNFKALLEAIPIDGFDFDLEEFDQDYTNTIVKLTLMLNENYGKEITYCPYNIPDFWLDCLAKVYQENNQKQIVSWFNLQCYAGGAYNDPEAWVNKIKNYQSPLGISDESAFIIPGYWVKPEGDKCPSDICQTFSNLKVKGGFIWNTKDIFASEDSPTLCSSPTTPTDYANAIINGLNRNIPGSGDSFMDMPAEGAHLKTLTLYSGDVLDSIQADYGTAGVMPKHGGNGGGKTVIDFATDEYIVEVSGKYGNYYGISHVAQLIIRTNKRTLSPVGMDNKVSNPTSFSFVARSGEAIIAFYGSVGVHTDGTEFISGLGVGYRAIL